MPYIQGSNEYPLLINVMPNCHEVRSSRLLQRIPRVQDLVLFYVFFMSSTSLTLSSSDIHVPEIFFLNFSAIILLWDFYLQFCSPDNPLGAYCLQRSLPPTGIQVCRSSTTTTVDHQQNIPNPNPKSYCLQRSLPPTGIQVCRSSATTTFEHQQKIPNPIPNHIVASFFLPPTDIQVCRSSTTTTFDHQQKIPNRIPNHIVTSFFLPPTDIQVCRSRASTTGPCIFLYKCWSSTNSSTLLSGLSSKGSKFFVVPKGLPW